MTTSRPVAELLRRYRQVRDNYMLVFILILFVVALTATLPAGGPGALFVTVVQGIALLLTLRNAGVRGRRLTFARVAAALPVLAVAAASLLRQPVGPVYYISVLLLIGGTQIAILRHAVRRGSITVDTVMGALCIYLLLGLLFATLDAMYAATVGPFFAQPGTHPASDYVYFSFITLATVGYGDLTPVPALPRILALAEGLFGQLYLVTVISLLVGNLGAERLERPSRRPHGE